MDLIRSAAVSQSACSSRHSVGFKLMCRFYAVQLYPWAKGRGYAFTVRFDDDGLLETPLVADLAAALRRGGYVYGFRAARRGKHGDVEASLTGFALRYTLEHEVRVDRPRTN